MECTHGKLCTWLSDGLCCHNSDCLTNLYGFSCCHVRTITSGAYTTLTLTGKDCTDLNLLKCIAVLVNALLHHTLSTAWSNHMVCLYNDITIFIFNVFCRETSCNTFLKTFDLFISIHECRYIHSRNRLTRFYAVCIVNDQFL